MKNFFVSYIYCMKHFHILKMSLSITRISCEYFVLLGIPDLDNWTYSWHSSIMLIEWLRFSLSELSDFQINYPTNYST